MQNILILKSAWLKYYLARLLRKILCYFKSVDIREYSIHLLLY